MADIPLHASAARGFGMPRAGATRIPPRLLLALALAAAGAGAWSAGDPAAAMAADADLGTLLRGMAAIKLAFAVPLLWAVWKRLGSPVEAVRAAGYLAAAAVLVAAHVSIWQLSHLGLTSLAFHSAGAAIVALACTDTRFVDAVFRRR